MCVCDHQGPKAQVRHPLGSKLSGQPFSYMLTVVLAHGHFLKVIAGGESAPCQALTGLGVSTTAPAATSRLHTQPQGGVGVGLQAELAARRWLTAGSPHGHPELHSAAV